jgi:hypothetical protein
MGVARGVLALAVGHLALGALGEARVDDLRTLGRAGLLAAAAAATTATAITVIAACGDEDAAHQRGAQQKNQTLRHSILLGPTSVKTA